MSRDDEAKQARQLLLELKELLKEIDECEYCFAPKDSLYEDHSTRWESLCSRIDKHLKKYSKAFSPN